MLAVLKKLGLWSWRLVMSGLLFLVVCVLGLRLFLSVLPVSHDYLVKYLNDKLNTSFVVGEVSAEWHNGRPSLSIQGLSLKDNDAVEAALVINRLEVELDLKSTLYNWSPVFTYFEADGISVALESDSDGIWSLSGIHYIRKGDSPAEFQLQPLLKSIQWQKYVDLTNISVHLSPYGHTPIDLNTRYFSLYEDAGAKIVETRIYSNGGDVLLKAQGAGVERLNSDWSGQVIVNKLTPADWCSLTRSCQTGLQSVEVDIVSRWHYHNGDWQLQGLFNLADLVFKTDKGLSPPLSLTADVTVEGDSPNNTWDARFKSLNIQSEELEPLTLSFDVKSDHQTEAVYELDLPVVELSQAKNVLVNTGLMPELVDELLQTLNPAGRLNNLAVKYYPSRPLRDAVALTAELEEVSVDAWQGAPSASNVNGRVDMGLLSGSLELDTKQFKLGLTKLFRNIWSYDKATATLTWDVLEKEQVYQLLSENIKLKGPDGNLSGNLRLDIPLDGKPIYMGLDVLMTDGDVRYTGKYLPSKLPTLSEELVSWLDDSIKGGKVIKGGFRYDGFLEETGDPDDTYWGLFFDLEDARLDYSPKWPEIYGAKGLVLIDGSRVKVDLDSARTLDTTLNNVSALVQYTDDTALEVTGEIQSSGKDLKKILTKTPIDQVMKGAARKWNIWGALNGNLTLRVPFKDLDNTSVDASVTTRNGTFAIPAAKLKVDHIQGDIAFSTRNGLAAKQIKGRFLGDEVMASITPGRIKNDEVTVFNWTGGVSSAALQQWLPLDVLSFLEGKTPYQGRLVIGQSDRLGSLTVTSVMRGMEIELPPPFQLKANDTAPLKLTLNLFEQGKNELAISLDGIGTSNIEFDDGFEFAAANLQFGPSDADPLPLTPGRIIVGGKVGVLDLEPWQQRFSGQPMGDDEASLLKQIDVDGLKIGQLVYKKKALDNLLINVKRTGTGDSGVDISVASRDIDGQLLLPDNTAKPYQLAIQRLHLPDSKGSFDKDHREFKDVLAGINPEELPDMDVRIESLKMGTRDFGALSFNLRPLPGGKRVEQFRGALDGIKLAGDADWVYVNGLHRSRYNGTLSGKGIEGFQSAIGVTPFVSAESTRIYSDLSWEGTPADIGMSSLVGWVSLKLKDGNLRKMEGGSDILKLLGIFNIEALTRRLRLDFSDLFRKGISFDGLNGRIRFDQGRVTFDEPLMIVGPSSDFKLDGLVDTNTDTLNMSLVVTLPVSSNLPVLSVLLGTAPQVAGIIYLADKLVGHQVDQLASIRYEIKGPMENPDISLDRLFSNQAKKPKKSSGKKK